MTVAGWVVLAPGTPRQRVVPIDDTLVVGRECAQADPSHRLILDDPAVSRVHLELRAQPEGGTFLVDLSTNGTRVNGRRLERGQPLLLHDGDRIALGAVDALFSARSAADPVTVDVTATVRLLNAQLLVAVVGDLVGYTALTEAHGAEAVGEASDALFSALATLVSEHRGTVNNYPGDAMFAAWDAGRDGAAAARAVEFAVAASELVGELAGTLPIRAADGPLQMGWAVALGETSSSRPSPGREVLHGDAVNLAFRLAGLAARAGRPAVLVTERAAEAAPDAASYGAVEELTVRGRTAPARVRAASRF